MPRVRRMKKSARSKSIPITKNIQPSQSEIQLREDEAIAEYHDYCMFVRIVNGLHEKKHWYQNNIRQDLNCYYQRSTEESLANIIRIRQLPINSENANYLFRAESTTATTDREIDSSSQWLQQYLPSSSSIPRMFEEEENDSNSEDRLIFELDL